MAELYRFFDSTAEDKRQYTADEFAEYFRVLLTNGVFNGGTQVQVYSEGTSRDVKIRAGFAWINGYLYKNTDDSLKFRTAEAHGEFDRIDRVVLRWDRKQRFLKAFIVQGTPAAVPVAPELTRNTDIYEISLARVLVPANTSVILPEYVADERYDSTVCGLVNSLVQVDTANFQNQWNDWYTQKTIEFQHQWDEWFRTFAPDASGDFDGWFTVLQKQWDAWFAQAQLKYNEVAYEENKIMMAMGGF